FMKGQYFLLISFFITSCTVNTISQTKLNDTYSMKSLLIASWGESQAEIIPTYVSSGLAFEITPTTKLAPILFELNDNKIYIIDASFKFLNIFDQNTFIQRIDLTSVITNNTIKSFKVLNRKEYVFVVTDEESTYKLIHWNFKTKETYTIVLGSSYRKAELVPSFDKNSIYYWTEKEDYTGILWQFSIDNLRKAPIKFEQFNFIYSRLFERKGKLMGVKYFNELNRRGLISVDLETEGVQEKVCSKELYGPLICPFGINQAGDLFTYDSPEEDQVYGTIFKINQDGILQENKSFNSLMSATFPDRSNTLLTPTQNWKVLPDGTIVLAVMTEKEVHIIALESQ
ncbi:MAG: Unknown protein, partial [uncultured Aureispira sp.]